MSQKIVISRIQNRRGLKQNLPQPLLPGEIALAVDEAELWIGGDPEFGPWGIRVYELSETTTVDPILENQIADIEFTSPFTEVDFNNLITYLTANPTPTVDGIEGPGFPVERADIRWDGLTNVMIAVNTGQLANLYSALQNITSPVAAKYVSGQALSDRSPLVGTAFDVDGVFFLDPPGVPASAKGKQSANAATLVNRSNGEGIVTTLSNLQIRTEGVATSNPSYRTVTILDTDPGYVWSATGSMTAANPNDFMRFIGVNGVDLDISAANRSIRFVAVPGEIDHDSLLNYSADQHALPKNSIELDAAELQLVGDVLAPGNEFYYGTDGVGTKGWHAFPVSLSNTVNLTGDQSITGLKTFSQPAGPAIVLTGAQTGELGFTTPVPGEYAAMYFATTNNAGNGGFVWFTDTEGVLWEFDNTGTLLTGTVPWARITDVPPGADDQNLFETFTVDVDLVAQSFTDDFNYIGTPPAPWYDVTPGLEAFSGVLYPDPNISSSPDYYAYVDIPTYDISNTKVVVNINGISAHTGLGFKYIYVEIAGSNLYEAGAGFSINREADDSYFYQSSYYAEPGAFVDVTQPYLGPVDDIELEIEILANILTFRLNGVIVQTADITAYIAQWTAPFVYLVFNEPEIGTTVGVTNIEISEFVAGAFTWNPTGSVVASVPTDELKLVEGDNISLDVDAVSQAIRVTANIPPVVAQNLFETVAVTDTDSGFTWAETGSVVADAVDNTLTLVSGAAIDLDVDATSKAVLVSVVESSIDHNALTNYAANEHALPKNSLEIDVGELQLVGDALTPGNEFYYGTNGTGTKGWYALPTPPTVIDTFIGLNDTPVNYTDEAGSILYVNGTADGVAYAPLYVDTAGTEYIAGTLVYPNQVVLESSVTVGAVGNEQNGIRLNGVNVPVRIKSSAFGQTASILCHQHSTTNYPQLLLARSNSDSAGHVAVINGMSVGELVGAGWAAVTPGYIPVGHIDFEVDATGTVSDTSMPGRLIFRTTPDGAVVPADAMYIDSSQSVVVGAATGGAQGAGTINAEGVYVNGAEILPQVVVNDSVHTGFVATETQFTLATTYITIAAQDETAFNGTGGNGTFVGGDGAGGTAYVAADTITLSDGTVITVDVVNGDGDVTEFTVTSASTSVFTTGSTLTQVSTSGTGTAFSITTGTNNEAASSISTLPVTGFVFDVDSASDVIFVDYSLNSGGAVAGTNNFTAIGTMRIVANVSAEGGLAALVDDQSDVRDVAFTGAVDFEAEFVAGAPNEVQIRYSNTLTSDVNMRIVIRRWMSY